jgi:hypothetical protein
MNRAHSKEHHDLNVVAAFSPEQSDTESDHGQTLNWPDLNRTGVVRQVSARPPALPEKVRTPPCHVWANYGQLPQTYLAITTSL